MESNVTYPETFNLVDMHVNITLPISYDDDNANQELHEECKAILKNAMFDILVKLKALNNALNIDLEL
jgi:hypothetical protein